jgi:hypothetical protein
MNILEQLKRERLRAVFLFLFFCVILFFCQWVIKEKANAADSVARTQEDVQ